MIESKFCDEVPARVCFTILGAIIPARQVVLCVISDTLDLQNAQLRMYLLRIPLIPPLGRVAICSQQQYT